MSIVGDKPVEGLTREVVVDEHIAWSVRHDNRLTQNKESVGEKKMTYDEEYDRIRSFTSLDLMQRFNASGSGEISRHRRFAFVYY